MPPMAQAATDGGARYEPLVSAGTDEEIFNDAAGASQPSQAEQQPAHDVQRGSTTGAGVEDAASSEHPGVRKEPTVCTLASYAMPSTDGTPLSAAAMTSAGVAVLACGTQLVAVRRGADDGAHVCGADEPLLWEAELPSEVGAANFPLALQPTGEQVAICMPNIKAISLRNVQTGGEIRQLSGGLDGQFVGVNYSSDGLLVLVFGTWGTKVYTASTGELVDQVSTNVCTSVSDPSGRFLVTTGTPAFVKDRNSGETVHTLDGTLDGAPTVTGGVGFDDAGERMAYWLAGKDMNINRTGQLIICDVKHGWRELRRFHFPNLGWSAHLQFSPGDGRFLLVGSHIRGGTMLILDAETGQEPPWGKCFRGLALPPGEIPPHTIRWVPPSEPVDMAESSKDETASLVLQAAVDDRLHIVDVAAFVETFGRCSGLPRQQRLIQLCEAFPDDRIGLVLSTTKASADAVEEVLGAIGRDSLETAIHHHPWLRFFQPGGGKAMVDSEEACAAEALRSAIEARVDVSVVSSLLERCSSGDAGGTSKSSDGAAVPLLYRCIEICADQLVILAVLYKWPEAVTNEGPQGTPLNLVASFDACDFETKAQMLVIAASFGQLSVDELAVLGSAGMLRGLAQHLEAPQGVQQLQGWLTVAPNFIMCCLSLAHAMRSRIAVEASHRSLFARTAEQLMDLATEFGLALESTLTRIEDSSQVKRIVESLLQPDPVATLQLAVRLHDIETVSVPWILDHAQTMRGSSLRFLHETWLEGGGTEINSLKRNGQPASVERLVSMNGAVWPFELIKAQSYLSCLVWNPLLGFRAPAVRYWFDTMIYLAFVLSFSYSLLLGPDTSGLGTPMTVYAWLWAAGTLSQELGQLYQGVRVYFEDVWNLIELGSPLLVGAGMVCHDVIGDDSMARQLQSCAVLLLWLKLLEVCEQFESVGPLVSVIVNMGVVLIQFSVLCLIFTLAWSVGLYALLRDTGAAPANTTATEWSAEYNSLPVSIFTLFRVYVGDFGYSFAGAKHEVTAQVMLGVYLVLIVVLLLNLLIAVLSVEHAKVYEDIDKEFAFTQTKAALRMRQKVIKHTLPPPLNLLQAPSSLCSMRGDYVNSGRRTAWLCWSVLAQPSIVVMETVLCCLVMVAAALQVSELPFVKRKERMAVPGMNMINPEGRWFKFWLRLFYLVGVLLMPLVLILLLPLLLQLPLRLMLGMNLPWLTFDGERTAMTPKDSRRLRHKHWPDDEKWDELIGDVVSEVFSTAEVEDGTVNPLRLNTEGRTRWLCERSLQSTRIEAETKEEVAKIDGAMKEKVAQLKDRMDSQHAETNAKLEEVKAMVAKLVELQQAAAR